MTGCRGWLVVLGAVFAVPSAALAQTLTGTGGYLWDFDGSNSGALINGTSDAYDGMYNLSVNGTLYSAGGTAPTIDSGGRRITTATRNIGGLNVSRRMYVPPTTTWWWRRDERLCAL